MRPAFAEEKPPCGPEPFGLPAASASRRQVYVGDLLFSQVVIVQCVEVIDGGDVRRLHAAALDSCPKLLYICNAFIQ